jgi:hypothetical protein
MDYILSVRFTTDNNEVVDDFQQIVGNIAVYMVDNVEVSIFGGEE